MVHVLYMGKMIDTKLDYLHVNKMIVPSIVHIFWHFVFPGGRGGAVELLCSFPFLTHPCLSPSNAAKHQNLLNPLI